jgi:hypothetical protein
VSGEPEEPPEMNAERPQVGRCWRGRTSEVEELYHEFVKLGKMQSIEVAGLYSSHGLYSNHWRQPVRDSLGYQGRETLAPKIARHERI